MLKKKKKKRKNYEIPTYPEQSMEEEEGDCHLSWRSWSCAIVLEKFIENIQLLTFWAIRIEKSIYSQERKRERKVEKEGGEVWKLER